jgi:hypothetical protein
VAAIRMLFDWLDRSKAESAQIPAPPGFGAARKACFDLFDEKAAQREVRDLLNYYSNNVALCAEKQEYCTFAKDLIDRHWPKFSTFAQRWYTAHPLECK